MIFLIISLYKIIKNEIVEIPNKITLGPYLLINNKKSCFQRHIEKKIEEVPEPKPEIPWQEKYLPAPEAATTTAAIAVVATTSALLAKPLADILLKVIKPTVKKVITKIAKIRGKTPKVLSLGERRAEQRDRNQAIQTLKKALKPKGK